MFNREKSEKQGKSSNLMIYKTYMQWRSYFIARISNASGPSRIRGGGAFFLPMLIQYFDTKIN